MKTMKKLLLFLFVISCTLTPTTLAQSGSDSATTPRQRAVNPTTRPLLSPTEKRNPQLKEQLLKIKDTKKQVTLERLDTKFTSINTRHTTQMTNVLNRLSSLTERVATKAAAEKKLGKDTSAVEEAVEMARDAIDEAEEAVASQAAKDYTVIVADETTVGAEAREMIQTLMSDLRSLHEKVKAAREKVIFAARTLATLKGETSPISSESAKL